MGWIIRAGGALLVLAATICHAGQAGGPWQLGNEGPSRTAFAWAVHTDCHGVVRARLRIGAVNYGENFLRPSLEIWMANGDPTAPAQGLHLGRTLTLAGREFPMDLYVDQGESPVCLRFYPADLAAADRLHILLSTPGAVPFHSPLFGLLVFETTGYARVRSTLFEEYGCGDEGELGWEYEPEALWDPLVIQIQEERAWARESAAMEVPGKNGAARD